jgi:hypothetical protein
MKRNEYAPMPQTWVSNDKIVTLTRCGNIETYTERDLKTGKVIARTYIKTS